jgi:hypothetical protein
LALFVLLWHFTTASDLWARTPQAVIAEFALVGALEEDIGAGAEITHLIWRKQTDPAASPA